MIRRPPRSTLDRSSAASDVYKRQLLHERLRPEQLLGRTQPHLAIEDVSLHRVREPAIIDVHDSVAGSEEHVEVVPIAVNLGEPVSVSYTHLTLPTSDL